MRTDARAPRPSDRGGFALVMVVMLLFAVAVAGATGYQIASAEHELATGGEAQQQALAIARAGLERYVGEHIGVPGAVTTYAVGTGTAVVLPRRILVTEPAALTNKTRVVDDTLQLWMIESIGIQPDPRHPTSPARRGVRQYAYLHMRAVRQKAAVINTNGIRVRNGSTVDGSNGDNNLPGGYPEAPLGCDQGAPQGPGVFGAIGVAVQTNGGTLNNGSKTIATAQLVRDTVGVRWGVLEDPNFPIPYDGSWPNFLSFPTDSFPVLRVSGNQSLDLFKSGWGVLIITGDATMSYSFRWNGIILAGRSTDMAAPSNLRSTICGMIVTGLDASGQGQVDIDDTLVQYQEWSVAMANRSLAFFELLDGTRWEF